MPLDLAEFSAAISFAALTVATYGIFERGKAASRTERVRLTTIVGELAKTRGELTEVTMKGQTIGDIIEVLHTRQELLSQQARSLIQEHELTITSSECREVAFNLAETGFDDDANVMWQLALETAKAEGKTQLLFASRGYAWFLFSVGREDEAREILSELLSEYTDDSDSNRLVRAQTISTWAGWEVRTEGDSTPVIAEFSRQIIELANASTTPRAKQMVMQHAFTVVNGTAVHVIQGQPSGNLGVPPTK